MFSNSRLIRLELANRAKIFLLVALAFVAYMLYQLAGASKGSPTYFNGVIESSGHISVASIAGGNAQAASVRLSDGRLVTAYVASDVPLLSEGDTVRVAEQESLAMPPYFAVIAKFP